MHAYFIVGWVVVLSKEMKRPTKAREADFK